MRSAARLVGLLAATLAALALACARSEVPGVPPSAETAPVPSHDDPDDAAIWFDAGDPEASLLIVTHKDQGGGLALHDLEGRLLHYADEDGGMNNVDLRAGFPPAGGAEVLVVATNRVGSRKGVAFYRLDPAQRRLARLPSRPFELGLDVYGICLYRNPETARMWFFVTGKDGSGDPRDGRNLDLEGKVQQWEILDGGDGHVAARLARSFFVGSQVEGCVADDARGVVYLAEERRGIWRYPAEPGAGLARTLVDDTEQGNLSAKIEGLAIHFGRRLLAASSHGGALLAFYELDGGNRYVGAVEIVASENIDGASGTEGIEILGGAVGERYPEGLIAVHDDDDDSGGGNFKLVPWHRVVGALAGEDGG